MWVREKADRDHMQAAERRPSPGALSQGASSRAGATQQRTQTGGSHQEVSCFTARGPRLPEVAAGLFPPEDRREVRPSPSPSSLVVCSREIASACGIVP